MTPWAREEMSYRIRAGQPGMPATRSRREVRCGAREMLQRKSNASAHARPSKGGVVGVRRGQNRRGRRHGYSSGGQNAGGEEVADPPASWATWLGDSHSVYRDPGEPDPVDGEGPEHGEIRAVSEPGIGPEEVVA